MFNIIDKIVPLQEEGWKHNTEESVEAANEDQAALLYAAARKRLMDVNQWHLLDKAMPAKFRLVQMDGIEIERMVEKGDYIRVTLAAPGTEAGEGYDWVKVAEMGEIQSGPGLQVVYILLQPSDNPVSAETKTAHFFSENSSNCIVVYRHQNKITAGAYGRNEKPNLHTGNLLDNARNALVALGSLVGFSKLQWKTLVKALLESDVSA